MQFDEVRGGASYLSQNDLRLHFGLGANDKMNEVIIRWPNGGSETLRNVAADFIYTIVEGSAIQRKVPLPPLPSPEIFFPFPGSYPSLAPTNRWMNITWFPPTGSANYGMM